MKHVIQMRGGSFYAPLCLSIKTDHATKFDTKDEANAFIKRFLKGLGAKAVPLLEAIPAEKPKDTSWIISTNSTVNWINLNLQRLEASCVEESRRFCWMTETGAGVNNIHMGELLRSLQFLYTDIAAHRHALHSAQEKLS